MIHSYYVEIDYHFSALLIAGMIRNCQSLNLPGDVDSNLTLH